MASITIGDQEIDLRLTMHRVRLLHEYTGLDLLNTTTEESTRVLKSTGGLTGALYALAGGPACGMPRDEFEDAIPLSAMPSITIAIQQTFERDAPNEESGSGNGNDTTLTSTS